MIITELKHLLSLASDIALETVNNCMPEMQKTKKVNVDLLRDVKIEADDRFEKIIIENLIMHSKYSILSEESGFIRAKEEDTDYYWIVDPLDGSLNYSRGIPICCISIALWKDMEPILGVVYDFNRNEMFTGIVGKGAWLNGAPIRVSEVAEEKSAVLCTGFPVHTNFSKESLTEFVEDIQKYKKIRLFGSAALSLAYVSCGRVDYYCENDIKIWDVAAGLALVKAANGIIQFSYSEPKHTLKVRASNSHLLYNECNDGL